MEEKNLPNDGVDIIIIQYKQRWLMLALFSVVSLSNASIFNTLGAINNIVADYYSVKAATIDWLGNIFCLLYLIVGLPTAWVISNYGLRLSLIITTSLNAMSTCFHFIGVYQSGFIYVIIGQVFAAMSCGFILQIPTRLASVWFGVKETATATMISTVANSFGFGASYLQSTNMVKASKNMSIVGDGIYSLYISQLIFMLTVLVLVYVFFEDHPKVPPSLAQHDVLNKDSIIIIPGFFKSIKILFSKINFILLTQVFGIPAGILTFMAICLNRLLEDFMDQRLIGWLGFAMICCGVISSMLSCVVLDKYKCFRCMNIVIMTFSLLAWIWFCFNILYYKHPVWLFISGCAVGFCMAPFIGIGMEEGVEIAYPIPEATPSCILMMFGNLYSFLLIYFVGSLVDENKIPLACYITSGIMLLSLGLSAFIKVKKSRFAGGDKNVNNSLNFPVHENSGIDT